MGGFLLDSLGGTRIIVKWEHDDGEPFWCYSQNPIAWRELPVPFGED